MVYSFVLFGSTVEFLRTHDIDNRSFTIAGRLDLSNLGKTVNVTAKLKSLGLKITAPRVEILQLLLQAPEKHWSVEAIYRALCKQGVEMGLATVYRVLTQFEKANLVNRHHFENGYAVFELAEITHHDHLVCTQCGKVEEFVDSVIEARQKLIAEKAKYKLTNHALNLFGVCDTCQ